MGRVFCQQFGGVLEVSTSLLKAIEPLCRHEGIEIEVLVPSEPKRKIEGANISYVVLPRFSRNILLWDHWTVTRYANRQQNAVLYNPKMILPAGLRIPGITTIHDLLYFPKKVGPDLQEYHFADCFYMQCMMRSTLKRSAYTHLISQNTFQDLLVLYPNTSKEKLKIIHHGIDSDDWKVPHAQDLLKQKGIHGKYILYVGTLSERKNVKVLLDAFGSFHKQHPEYQLVITGGSKTRTKEAKDIMKKIQSYPDATVLHLGAIDHDFLSLLYHQASFFVYPSLYEGFGLPPLEAQICDCPVICSNASSLPEVVGDSALLFYPMSTAELIKNMERLTKEETRQEYVAKGKKNVDRFSWNTAAEEFMKLVKEALPK